MVESSCHMLEIWGVSLNRKGAERGRGGHTIQETR